MKTYNECVIKRCEDVGYAEDMLSLSNSRPERHVLLFHFPRLPSRLLRKTHQTKPNQNKEKKQTVKRI